MNTSREVLEQQLEDDEEELRGLKSYVHELKAMTAKYGTDKAQYEEDLAQAEHNVKYYDAGVADLKKQLGALPRAPRLGGGRPQPPKPSPNPFLLSSISFVAGALLGSRLGCGSRRKDED